MRPDKIKYYLNIARSVSERSTCLRRRYGALIVKNDEIISTGYNGAPRNVHNCIDKGICLRQKLNIPPGERYESCKSVHSEANAIISAARRDMIDSTLYLIGIESDTGNVSKYHNPCLMCRRLIINAGISKIYMAINENLDYETSTISKLILESNVEFDNMIK